MTTLLYSHPICIEHDPGSGHPECPDRLRSVMRGFEDEDFSGLKRLEAPMIDMQEVEQIHQPFYIEQILENIPKEGRVFLDADTAMSPASVEASRRAAGAVCDAVDQVMKGKADNAFCAVRPPGHHAESGRAMGFCLFNSVAIGAMHGRARHGLDRVAVIDFDVHHGNGTQHSFEHDAGLFYGSSHQWPAYPGTGAQGETGEFDNICNFPMAPGDGSAVFRDGYQERILPALRAFDPDLLLISAGFDAHDRDPLAQICLQTEDYAWVTDELMAVADECCDGRVVSLLEGGYNLDALRESAQAHVRTLMGKS
ncbi:MAG: histone deacetylase family protein [Proteobacteria bacterium]|nr:histone deacetylase family protein [Pseudomonadota bacterium]MDA1021836.1 histone deacetylase family protein [Pseudomonadota bacterium]